MNSELIRRRSISPGRARQDGVVLIVCLIILLVVTLLGVSSMQSSSVQLKMAKNGNDRQVAFQSAEYTLKRAEKIVLDSGHLPSAYQGTSSIYNADCNNDGRCFSGLYEDGQQPSECDVSARAGQPYWADNDMDVWGNGANHETVSIPGDVDVPDGKFIVEFMCYGDKDDTSDCATDSVGCAALYRITSLATSQDGLARVMLQSMIKVVYQ